MVKKRKGIIKKGIKSIKSLKEKIKEKKKKPLNEICNNLGMQAGGRERREEGCQKKDGLCVCGGE